MASLKRKNGAIRARATNDTITVTYRLKKSQLTVPGFAEGKEFKNWCPKHGLWRLGDGKYTMLFQHGYIRGDGVVTPGATHVGKGKEVARTRTRDAANILRPLAYADNVTFIGLVEHGHAGTTRTDDTNTYELHVSVRGIVHLPRWWFTENEMKRRLHNLFGRMYSRRLNDTTGLATALYQVANIHDFPAGTRNLSKELKLVEVYFRV